MRQGRVAFQSLKNSANSYAVQRLAVGSPPVAYLRPLATHPSYLNKLDIECLTNWRNQHVSSFLSEFQATYSRTINWVVHTVGESENKILFMLDDLQGESIGYLGLSFIDWERSYGEADAIVRGTNSLPGVMHVALKALLKWADNELLLTTLCVRVRSDNQALKFYEKVGFKEIKRVPIFKAETKNEVVWVEGDGSSSHQLVYMQLLSKVE